MTIEKGFCVHEGRKDAYEACECWGRQERTESGGQVTAGVEGGVEGGVKGSVEVSSECLLAKCLFRASPI